MEKSDLWYSSDRKSLSANLWSAGEKKSRLLSEILALHIFYLVLNGLKSLKNKSSSEKMSLSQLSMLYKALKTVARSKYPPNNVSFIIFKFLVICYY